EQIGPFPKLRRISVQRPANQINWVSVLAYLFIGGGLTALSLFLAVEYILRTGLAAAFLFMTLGGAAYLFYLREGGRGWRWLAALWWVGALATLFLHMMVEGWLHPALGMAVGCFLAAAVVLGVAGRRREKRLQREIEFQALGSRADYADEEPVALSAAEHEAMMAQQRRGGEASPL